MKYLFIIMFMVLCSGCTTYYSCDKHFKSLFPGEEYTVSVRSKQCGYSYFRLKKNGLIFRCEHDKLGLPSLQRLKYTTPDKIK